MQAQPLSGPTEILTHEMRRGIWMLAALMATLLGAGAMLLDVLPPFAWWAGVIVSAVGCMLLRLDRRFAAARRADGRAIESGQAGSVDDRGGGAAAAITVPPVAPESTAVARAAVWAGLVSFFNGIALFLIASSAMLVKWDHLVTVARIPDAVMLGMAIALAVMHGGDAADTVRAVKSEPE